MRPDNQRVGAYVKAWIESLTLAQSTILRHSSIFATHIEPHELCGVRMSEVDSQHVKTFYGELRKGGASESTIKKAHSLLHSAFEAKRYGKDGATFRNPCDLPKNSRPKYKAQREAAPFDPDKEAAFLTALHGDPWEALYVLALDSGMRQAELFSLEWRDIDWASGTVEVRRTLKDTANGLDIGETKNKARRAIKLAPTTCKALDAHRRVQSHKDGLQRLVFPDQAGGYLRRQNFDRRSFATALRRAQEQSGFNFTGHTFHDLRHTCATLLLQDGEAIPRVSQRLGHSTVKTTLDFYAHAVPQDEDRPAARFEQRRARGPFSRS